MNNIVDVPSYVFVLHPGRLCYIDVELPGFANPRLFYIVYTNYKNSCSGAQIFTI